MFRKFMTMIGIYTFCVFVHKTSNAMAPKMSDMLDKFLDDYDPKKP